MGLLKDKIALVTGASRGIGRGIATVFAKNGCSVAFTYNNNKEMADSLEKELAVYNIKSKSYKIDLCVILENVDFLSSMDFILQFIL